MDELDLLKNAWKKDNQSFQQISENEIYKMIHQKSSSTVKWILIISILEFILWNITSILFNSDSYIKTHYPKNIIGYVMEIDTFYNFISCSIIVVFIYLFYKNYKNISATSSTRKLMSDILKTRKTVIYYIWFNIMLFIAGTLTVFFVEFNYNPEIIKRINGTNGSWILMKAFGMLLLFVVLIWLFYRLVYGILLRKLYKNYKELEKIELE